MAFAERESEGVIVCLPAIIVGNMPDPTVRAVPWSARDYGGRRAAETMTTDKQHLAAPLQLRYGSGLLLAGDSVRLLEAIARDGSINRAAKAVGISYRTARQRVESLNNLASSPLVARATGGRGGGGTRLT